MVNIKIKLTLFFAAEDGETLYSQQKQDQDLTVDKILNSLLQNSGLKKVGNPSADEWIRKLWYIYTMEYYSAIKKNAFEKETLMYRTVLWTLWERERVGRFGRLTLKHVKYHVRNELPVQVRCTILDAWG